MTHHVLLIAHLLGASIWVGGHLLLAISYVPKALKNKDPEIITQFERKYEALGLPALAVLVFSGIWMSLNYGVRPTDWLRFSSAVEIVVSIKLSLLLLTVLLALHARFFIIPKLSKTNIPQLALHIYAVTVVGISMLVLGSFVRFGGM